MINQTYADIIVDISLESLDKTYQYSIPIELIDKAVIGSRVLVSFGKGNREISGYIVDISNKPKLDKNLIKPIKSVLMDAPVIESQLISLAAWMKENFGGTMNEALKTVIPVKKAVKNKEHKQITLAIDQADADKLIEQFTQKNAKAKLRFLTSLMNEKVLDYDMAINDLHISRDIIKSFDKLGIIKLTATIIYRNPINNKELSYKPVQLNAEQLRIVEDIAEDYRSGIRETYLIHGITGSGKTEVYMDIIDTVVSQNKQVIMLIPEIALTYQTVLRFYRRFGNRVSILNSKLSQGERYDQSLRAKNGEIDIIIGPRSALFTPFERLGLIIIDEEHEGSYKSETTPRYHATSVAIKRAAMSGASVILGSATPSLESYDAAIKGKYKLYTLTKRAKAATPPRVWIVDLKEELSNKNKSIFSNKLRELITDRLNKKEQIMLFLNRRGYAGFVSCRSCGYVIKCPHCDLSMTSHNNGKTVCHFCGHEEVLPKICPVCGSRYIAAFGTGTQKVEELVKKEFPLARVLRMDTDTTKNKGGHERILSAFSENKADILVGTQMIVKGHDFPRVTLVGIIAADLSLYAGDFRAGERTFQLLCQAAGRAGRDILTGEVVIQTYHPEHYSVVCAAKGDYNQFYQQEMLYRKMAVYPPAAHILLIIITSKNEERGASASILVGDKVKAWLNENAPDMQVIGPAPANISKANDIYRKVIYIKHQGYDILVRLKDYIETYYINSDSFTSCNLQFDFDPMSSL